MKISAAAMVSIETGGEDVPGPYRVSSMTAVTITVSPGEATIGAAEGVTTSGPDDWV